MVLEVLSREFKSGCPQELLYAGNLVQIAVSIEELLEKFKKLREDMVTKGINMKKTKNK